jgi:hypothetical protein
MSTVNEGAPAGERLGVELRRDRIPSVRLPGGRLPNRRNRNRALLLTSLALAFYFGFIALTFYRSHH